MGGECNATIVYGFQVNDTYVKLLGGGDMVNIGSDRIHGYPIYYCSDLQHYYKQLNRKISIAELPQLIENLDENERKIMAEFDIFAAKYGYTPSWQLCCVGDFEVQMADRTHTDVIERLNRWKHEIVYDEEEKEYTEDAKETIELILIEEYMRFMIPRALETKCADEIIDMVNEFYSNK